MAKLRLLRITAGKMEELHRVAQHFRFNTDLIQETDGGITCNTELNELDYNWLKNYCALGKYPGVKVSEII